MKGTASRIEDLPLLVSFTADFTTRALSLFKYSDFCHFNQAIILSFRPSGFLNSAVTFEEVGCIHTAQGLEFDYVGVLIGKDLKYVDGRVVTDKTAISVDDKSSGIRGASDDVARRLILNTYKTLLTRGQKGCFVYCEDEGLREYLKAMIR